MWNQYTYAQDHNGRRYYCSKNLSGCKAGIKLTIDGRIEWAKGHHAHPPPVYTISSAGDYVKIG